MSLNDESKKIAGEHAVLLVKPGMTLGIGTGSTVYWFIKALAPLVKQGLDCRAVPTSKATAQLAQELHIPLCELNDVSSIDLTVDGADEIDPLLQLIKGGGGALLQEKMVAAASQRLVIIADHTKLVNQLGRFPLPVEVVPYGWRQVQHHLEKNYGVPVFLRKKNDAPFITDHGHYILDVHFAHIEQPASLQTALNTIPGVVENGLFINMAAAAIIAHADGSLQTLTRPA